MGDRQQKEQKKVLLCSKGLNKAIDVLPRVGPSGWATLRLASAEHFEPRPVSCGFGDWATPGLHWRDFFYTSRISDAPFQRR
jgi:hypothetical protein